MKKWICFLFALALSVIILSGCVFTDLIQSIGNNSDSDTDSNTTQNSGTVANRFTVTFLNYDNSLLFRAEVDEGQPAIYEGNTPVRPETIDFRYEFTGWDKDLSAIYSNLATFAQFNAINKTTDSGNDKNADEKTTLDSLKFAKAETTIEKNKSLKSSDIISFRDDDYYYFVFDLAKFYNIPVDSTYDYCTYGGTGDVMRTMTASTASSNTIQNSTTKTHQETTTFSSTKSVDASFTIGRNPPSPTGGITWSFHVGIGYSRTKGNTDTDSWTESYNEAASYSSSEARTTTISFNSGDPAGNYYYYLSVDTQVYGTIIKSISTGEFYVTTYSSVIGRGFNYVYCGQENLQFKCNDKLDFDYTAIISDYELNTIVPTNYIGSKTEDDGKIHIDGSDIAGFYNTLKNAKATDVIVLDNDINCESYPWVPLDNFVGKLDGNGHTISNINYSLDSGNSDNIFGIFKQLSGTVCNVKFSKLTISVHKLHDTVENIYVGGICGILKGGTIELVTIEESKVWAYHDSDDKTRKTRAFVGGFVGELESGSIISSNIITSEVFGKTRINYNTDSKADCWSYAGGFVGHMVGGSVSSCIRYNNATVTAYTLSGSKASAYHCHVGGIAGFKDGGSITSCTSTETGLTKTTEIEGGRQADTSTQKLGAETGN